MTDAPVPGDGDGARPGTISGSPGRPGCSSVSDPAAGEGDASGDGAATICTLVAMGCPCAGDAVPAAAGDGDGLAGAVVAAGQTASQAAVSPPAKKERSSRLRLRRARAALSSTIVGMMPVDGAPGHALTGR